MFGKRNPRRLASEERVKGELTVNVRKASGDVAFHVRQSSRRAILLSVTFLACPFATWAQESQAADPIAPSGLAAENLNRVAASAAPVEELLRKEPGLLVELKRWVAKEATDRGQILDDADLTEKAIFERLTRDLEFRSVATPALATIWLLGTQAEPRFRGGQGARGAVQGTNPASRACRRRGRPAGRGKRQKAGSKTDGIMRRPRM